MWSSRSVTNPPERAAQLPGDQQLSGTPVQSTPSMPDAPVEGEDDDVITKPPSWDEQMELLENQQNPSPLDTLGKRPKGEKLSLTKVDKEMEYFLHEAFSTMENEDHKDLQRQFIVPDALSPWRRTLTKSWQQSAQSALKLQIRRTRRSKHCFLTQLGH